MQINRKRTNKIEASYTLVGTFLENVDSIKYLGVIITYDEMEYSYISNMCNERLVSWDEIFINVLRMLKRQHLRD